ncbi:zinc transport system substrate-binding protein [Alkalibacterium putridalgicola]|uniref:Zinc ABC transporter substrate-binding protein n=1 Tax=Alkalibacterium putridalgicola TaxID=426703 RepID=A0A1H7U0U3_9LACT|nr:zinc ABC transporter substrate-binding protein [Alkalibacterium putridalgicola]GEK89520.1 zinc ABC transporter substrate-binding protein [Alkalibacterium putridalgicola]SEL90399.1 zinc transport system substrate-binding protein [Alkalibacterium putridalgicola]
MRNLNKVLISLLSLSTLAACAPESQEPVEDNESSEANATNETNEETDTASTEEEKLSVVTTFYPVYEFTDQVAGDHADIEMMITGGTDVHHYEPSARDMAMINDADMFVYSSDEMETWVQSMLASLDNEDLVVVEQAAAVDLIEAEEDEHAEDEHGHEDEEDVHAVDPHIWLDPVLVQEQVETVKEAFINIDPDRSESYTANAEAYQSDLQDLHEEFEAAFSDAEQRRFVTQHEAFGYIAHRYDLTQMAVGGLSTEVEVSPSRIAEINQLVEEFDIPVIYFQEGANSAIAETVANETGAEVAELYSLESLPAAVEDDGQGYIEAMKRNLEALEMSIQ